MKQSLIKCFLVIALTFGVFAVTNSAQAYYYYGTGYTCKWVSGHHYNGRWIPGHKACWNTRHYERTNCAYVRGHQYNGYWYPAHRVCRGY